MICLFKSACGNQAINSKKKKGQQEKNSTINWMTWVLLGKLPKIINK